MLHPLGAIIALNWPELVLRGGMLISSLSKCCARRPPFERKMELRGRCRIHRLSLCFDASVEEGYAESLSDGLVKSMLYAALAHIILYSVYLSTACWHAECHTSELHHKVAVSCRLSDIALIMGIALMTLIMLAQCRWRCLSPRSVEVCAVVVCMSSLAGGVFTEHFYMARLLNIDDVYKRPVDSWLLLYINCFVTVSHTLMPIRWCMLWPLEVLGSLLFPVLALVPRPSPYPTPISLTMVLLVILSSLGKRLAEVRDREAYSVFLSERTLRVHSEFQLARQQDRGRACSRALLHSFGNARVWWRVGAARFPELISRSHAALPRTHPMVKVS